MLGLEPYPNIRASKIKSLGESLQTAKTKECSPHLRTLYRHLDKSGGMKFQGYTQDEFLSF